MRENCKAIFMKVFEKSKWLGMTALIGLLAGAGSAVALAQAQQEPPVSGIETSSDVGLSQNLMAAHRLVESTTNDLIELIEQARAYVDDDQPRFYRALGELLRQYVDFESFSRAVMGKYASTKRFASLSPEEKRQLEMQVDRFNEVFTGALINTYGKGLLVFEGERIEVLLPSADDEAYASRGKARIKQLIYGDRVEPYVIYYSLRKNSDDAWRIRNMIIESSNLGKIYRNQFDNAYKVYDGDIDRVVENWVVGAEAE